MIRGRVFGVPLAALALLALWFALSPPRWWLNRVKRVDLSDPVATGRVLAEKYECFRCHREEERRPRLAPSLDGVTERFDDAGLRKRLRGGFIPWSPGGMPNLHLSDSEIEAIVAYLAHRDAQLPPSKKRRRSR